MKTGTCVRYGSGLAACLAMLLGLAAGPAGRCAAQDPAAVASDRPGFGDGSAVVTPGRLQVEAGYAYSDLGPDTQHALGQVVLRLGVVDRVELRALLNSYVAVRGEADATGFQDVVVGAKVNVLPGAGVPLGQPAVSVLVSAALPTGSDAFTSDAVQAEAKLALDLGLTETLAFSANVGQTFASEGDLLDQFFTYVALGGPAPGVKGLGVFAGLYSLFPREGDSGHGLDGGFTYLPDPATQLDVNVGVGLTDGEPDFVVGAGVARRF